jgi:hypothetical protein
MSGFKLIAIRPLVGCEKKYSKVLELGEFYKFYNDYDLTSKIVNKNEEIEVKYTPSVSKDLFNISRSENDPLFVNVSAIVGKNGTGKSTLIELFFLVVYLISIEKKKIILKDDKSDNKELEKIKKGLKVEVYYSIETSVYCLRCNNSNNVVIDLLKTEDLSEDRNQKLQQIFDINFELEEFFYSVAINYSIHGLNSSLIGNWINKLFHKNDGYQTPVVINPMRDRGNFDINEENYFAKTRLISNLLTPNEKEENPHHLLTDNQKAIKFIYTLKESKIRFAITRDIDNGIIEDVTFDTIFLNNSKNELLKSIYKILFEIEVSEDNLESYFSYVKYYEETIKYILKKLIKISRTYDNYKDYFKVYLKEQVNSNDTKTNNVEYHYTFFSFDEYLKKLKKDNSHITFKLNQAINYLKNDILKDEKSKLTTWKVDKKRKENFEISVSDLSNRIEDLTKNNSEIINFIPPSLFYIDIILERIDKVDKDDNYSNFNDLSSGEQQLIHSVQSVLYHLINVNSVFNQPKEKNEKKKRNTYSYVNIIFDEVELYFHPEYQRNFISFFLTSLSRISIPKITAINILFSTHSPFILSDIPISNILRLSKNNIKNPNDDEQTFGSNINDLLANDFFLEKGFIGQFAKNYIINLFEELYKLNEEKNKILSHEEYLVLLSKITLIGERVIRIRLVDLLDEIPRLKFEQDFEIEKLSKRIMELKRKRR